MLNSVEQDDFDIQTGLQSTWAISFSVLYLIVISLSVLLYLATIRALAIHGRRQAVTYYLVLLLFFAALVEFAVLIEEFMNRFGYFLFTTANCRLFKYTITGNRILQVSVVLTMLYYNTLAVYLKTTRYELIMRQWFPLLVAFLLLVELITTLPPALNIRANKSNQWCELIDKSSRQLDGWLHAVILPYWLPLLFAIFPSIFLALKLKERHLVEPRKSQVQVCLAVSGSYFLFHLLYFVLLAARLIEAGMMNRDKWNVLLGMSVWFITRPMFALIGLGWHLMVPLACLTLDKELCREWPGRLMVKDWKNDVETEGSIPMERRMELEEIEEDVKSRAVSIDMDSSGKTELSPNFSALMLENREFHNPTYPVH